MNKFHKELLYKHNQIQNNYLKNKIIVSEDDLIKPNKTIKPNKIINTNKIIKNIESIENTEINSKKEFNLIIDNIQYILKKDISNLNSLKNKYITYKQINNNTNYKKQWPKKYTKICFICYQKLIHNNKEQYYCEFCDKIELNYNSSIYLNDTQIDLKTIIWNEKNILIDEISTINSNIFFLDSNNYICIEKKVEILLIDNIQYSIIWYYNNNNTHYAFIKGFKYFEIYNNSIILFNNNKLTIHISKYDNTYYKLIINNIPLSGNRYRPDLYKLLN